MKGFSTEAAAQTYYTANRHVMQVVRTCREDDIKFGPLDVALDVNWAG